MTETGHDVLALMVGAALGGIFFGGLWWTVRRLATSARPARLMLVSLAIRSGAVLAGVFMISDAHWQRMALCAAGFALVRVAALRRARDLAAPPSMTGEHT